MSSHHLIITFMFFGFIIMLGILYGFAHLWERFISQSKKKQEDRDRFDALGEEEVVYSNDYFNKLSGRSKVGENLPTRPCEKCGAGLNPEDNFCPICGEDVSSWIGSGKDKN